MYRIESIYCDYDLFTYLRVGSDTVDNIDDILIGLVDCDTCEELDCSVTDLLTKFEGKVLGVSFYEDDTLELYRFTESDYMMCRAVTVTRCCKFSSDEFDGFKLVGNVEIGELHFLYNGSNVFEFFRAEAETTRLSEALTRRSRTVYDYILTCYAGKSGYDIYVKEDTILVPTMSGKYIEFHIDDMTLYTKTILTYT